MAVKKKITTKSTTTEPKKTRTKSGDGCEYIVIDRRKLKNAPYNPRTIDPLAAKRLAENIKRTGGLVQPPVWNQQTGNIVGGHQRVAQLDILKGTDDYQLTVAMVNWPLTKEIEQNVALNNQNIEGRYDLEKLDELLSRDDVTIDHTGFDMTALELMHIEEGLPLPQWMLPEEEQESQEAFDEFVEEMEELGEEGTAQLKKEQEKIDEIKKRKKDFKEGQKFMNHNRTHITVAFPTNGSRARFMELFGVDPTAEFIDGMELADCFEWKDELEAVILSETPERMRSKFSNDDEDDEPKEGEFFLLRRGRRTP